MSLCLPPLCYGSSSASGSLSKAKATGDYVSVTEQSGIKAGDGGFQVAVNGNTDLQGAVIASSNTALQEKRNSLITGTLTSSDLQNKDHSEASGFSLSGSVSGKMGDQSSATSAADKAAADNKLNPSNPGGSAGVGSVSGSQDNTSRAGVSGAAITLTDSVKQQALTGASAQQTLASLNRDVSSDSATGLKKKWDGKQMEQEVQAQTQITAAFGQAAAKSIGDYADQQRARALASGDPVEAAKWDEGGLYRVAAHVAAGALSGGVAGALGAGASATLMPEIGKQIDAMNLPDPVKQALGAATAAAIGAVAGGTAGATTGFNIDVNNRQLDPKERKWAKDNVKQYQQYLADKTGEKISAEDAYQRLLSAGYAVVDDAASKTGKSDETAKQFIAETKPLTLFKATATERMNPFLGGNADGSMTPEQQARFGAKTPGETASKLVTKAMDYMGTACGTNCGAKFDAINNAIGSLEAAKPLYQDDPGSIKVINQQIAILKGGLTQNEAARGGAQSISDVGKNLALMLSGASETQVAFKGVAADMIGTAAADVKTGVIKASNLSDATSSFKGVQLNEYYRQAEKYGDAGIKELDNGRFRFYGEITPARNPGEMVGARLVREWDLVTDNARTWYETIDSAGTVRSVAPKPVTDILNHRLFDKNGQYTGRR